MRIQRDQIASVTFSLQNTIQMTILSLLVKCSVILIAVTVPLRIAANSCTLRWMYASASALVMLHVYIILRTELPPDYHIFWRAGRDIWESLDPYDPVRFAVSPFLNPPTAIPLFTLFAAVPYRLSLIIWTFLNCLFCCAARSGAACPASTGRTIR